MNDEIIKPNYLKIFFIVISCILFGGLIGAILNIINLFISSTYFINILDWGEENIWFFTILQGIIEGIIYGGIFSIIYVIVFEIITKNIGTYNFAFKVLLKTPLIIFFCWIVGGIFAIILATISPELYKSTFYMVPEEKTAMLKYAWVGGSIWGEIFGGILALISSTTGMKYKWNLEKK